MIVGTPSIYDLTYIAVKGNDIIKAFEKYGDAVEYENKNSGVDIICCRDDMVERFYEKTTNKFGIKLNPAKIREAWKLEKMLSQIF